MKNRKIKAYIKERSASKTGKIFVYTGARQTGKTTLSRHLFPDFKYLSIDDPVLCGRYKQLSAKQWFSQLFLLSNDYDTQHFDDKTTAINVAYFLS